MTEKTYDYEAVLKACAKQDYTLAYSLTRPFAESGVADAQCMMGSFYQLGTGVD
ncbi:MAG: hypothetical protein ACR2I2_19395 [Bryobacteraceae bacterium]